MAKNCAFVDNKFNEDISLEIEKVYFPGLFGDIEFLKYKDYYNVSKIKNAMGIKKSITEYISSKKTVLMMQKLKETTLKDVDYFIFIYNKKATNATRGAYVHEHLLIHCMAWIDDYYLINIGQMLYKCQKYNNISDEENTNIFKDDENTMEKVRHQTLEKTFENKVNSVENNLEDIKIETNNKIIEINKSIEDMKNIIQALLIKN